MLPLYVGERVCLDGNKKAKMVKKHHKSVWKQIKRKNNQCVSKTNKSSKCVIFEPCDLIWVHTRKKIFLAHRWSKMHHRGDDPF